MQGHDSFLSLAETLGTQPKVHGKLHRTELLEEFRDEFQPQGAAETMLVAEIARRADELERTSAAATAWRDFANKLLQDFVFPGIIPAGPNAGLLVENLACPAVRRAQQACLAHSCALSRALQQLLRLQERRMDGDVSSGVQPASPYRSERTCLDYLAAWQRRNFACPRCASPAAHFILSRPCLECSDCHTQCGLRCRTVMADSPLPLCIWFLAIRLVLQRPTIKTRTLQRKLGLRRTATVRGLRTKIHQALVADDRPRLLAGLDQSSAVPELGVQSLVDHRCPRRQHLRPWGSHNPYLETRLRKSFQSKSFEYHLSQVSDFQFSFYFPWTWRSTMNQPHLPLNLPSPETASTEKPQPERQAQPGAQTHRHIPTVEECLAAMFDERFGGFTP